MLEKIMQLFSMTEADAQRVDAMEVLSRAKAARQKANRALNIAEQQVTKAEQALYTARLENQNSYRDYLFARQTTETAEIRRGPGICRHTSPCGWSLGNGRKDVR